MQNLFNSYLKTLIAQLAFSWRPAIAQGRNHLSLKTMEPKGNSYSRSGGGRSPAQRPVFDSGWSDGQEKHLPSQHLLLSFQEPGKGMEQPSSVAPGGGFSGCLMGNDAAKCGGTGKQGITAFVLKLQGTFTRRLRTLMIFLLDECPDCSRLLQRRTGPLQLHLLLTRDLSNQLTDAHGCLCVICQSGSRMGREILSR